jgi:hypothetical protein
MWMSGDVALGFFAMLALAAAAAAQAPPPQTRAERTAYEETTRYDEVRAFIDALAATGRVRVESFGRSEEGRDLPLMIIGDPPAASPEQARAAGRPVVFVMGNIHAGEVEGKEAILHLARRMTGGDLQPLLNGAVWLFAPIYNADGNERISVENRWQQNGPIGGVGTRENARGLDLNRDFMKLDTSEGRALVALLARWDPDVVIDLHTTNGSYHGYHLTYSPSLNPNADARLLAYARERLLPAVSQAMASRHNVRTYYYGNFTTLDAMNAERLEFATGETGTRVWRTFDHRPRFGNHYVGLRNRIAILSEAYSYLDFAGRVRVTEAFVEEIMRFVTENAAGIRALLTSIDAAPPPAEAGVTFELAALPAPVDILVGAVEQKMNPRSGRAMTAMIEDRAVPTPMLDYGRFVAGQTRRLPPEYVVPARPDGLHQTIAARLRLHGIGFREIDRPAPMNVERFVIRTVTHAERSFQGHQETTVAGVWEQAAVDLPGGSLVISTNQPLSRLIFYLLEPESDDGLTTWNVLDAALAPGATHPVLKVRR